MPLSRTRDYLSIGEVLDSLRPDFPDVTISKIRFLETEGLIDPERTSSGYRKFYESDVARLRYILALQRDHFLPLKIIRTRLAEADANGGGTAPDVGDGPVVPPASDAREPLSLDRNELQQAAGLADEELRGLMDFGLLRTEAPYDRDDLAAASAAKALFKFGVEPRHLRMYRQFADREASFFEQIVSPAARRRDPDARREAEQAVGELMELARRFRDAVLRSTLRSLT